MNNLDTLKKGIHTLLLSLLRDFSQGILFYHFIKKILTVQKIILSKKKSYISSLVCIDKYNPEDIYYWQILFNK